MEIINEINDTEKEKTKQLTLSIKPQATSLKCYMKQTKPLVNLSEMKEKRHKHALETRERTYLTTDSEEIEKNYKSITSLTLK